MKHLILSACILSLVACSDSDDNDTTAPTPETFNYAVVITNLTNAQPFSPIGGLLHDATFHAWSIGTSASIELENLAESGNANPLLASRSTDPNFIGTAALFPGASVEFEVTATDSTGTFLTVGTMLINTNDAFSGVTGKSLASLATGESITYKANAYDAGTEFNDELAANIPGPAGGGEGFNEARNDVNSLVSLHGGVVTQQDGYAESTLTEADRFDNAVIKVVVTRL